MRLVRIAALAATSLMLIGSTPSMGAQVLKPTFAEKGPFSPKAPADLGGGSYQALAPVLTPNGPISIGFEALSQYDTASFGRNFIPPDTMGAVGTTQYVQIINGGFGVFDKGTGARLAGFSDNTFWTNAGLTTTNGDPRILFNAQSNRWIAIAFGADVKDINIAVSDTADALGTWRGTSFVGYDNPTLFQDTADYPTLAIDKNAIYIGTNNFASTTAAGARNFRGTTLSVLPLADILAAGGPITANVKKFETAFTGGGGDEDNGFAIQGVNSNENSTTGNIVAISLFDVGVKRYDILNAGTAGATKTATSATIGSTYVGNSPARQPDAVPEGNGRLIDNLDDRIGTNAWEVNGKIYAVYTVSKDGALPGIGDKYSRVRVIVLNSLTNAILDEIEIGAGTDYDYYMGSLAVNDNGDVVVGYNRSGSQVDAGKIKVMARTFKTEADGGLTEVGSELLLKDSLVDDYHNGSLKGQPGAGRQRWGDYSAVNLDPLDQNKFWVIGQFAREYNTPEDGHPGGTGGSRWSNWVAAVDFAAAAAVPEPATWAMMIIGFGFVGASMRRARINRITYA